MVLTPARPCPSGPGPEPHPAGPVVTALSPGSASLGPRLPGTAGKPDDDIICGVRPRQGRRRRRAVLAVVLAGTVLAGLLIWRAGPGAPGRAMARHPGAVIHMARARQQRRRQRAAQAAVDTITVAVGGGAAADLYFRGLPRTAQPPHPRPGLPGHGPKALANVNVLGSACHGDVTGIVPEGRDAWVICSNGIMLEMDAATGTEVGALDGLRSVSTARFIVMAIAADGGRIWVTNTGGGSVTELNAITGAPIRVLHNGPRYQFNQPGAIAADGHRIWIANLGSNSVTELNAVTGAPIRVLRGPRYQFNQPGAIAAHGHSIWIANEVGGSVTELNAITGAPIRVLRRPRYQFKYPGAIAADSGRIWVANTGGNSVTELNAVTGALVRVLRGPRYQFNQPDVIAADGARVWVGSSTCPSLGSLIGACYNNGNPVSGLTELNAATGAPVRVLNGSRYGFAGPIAVAPHGRLWVTNYDGDSVTELHAAPVPRSERDNLRIQPSARDRLGRHLRLGSDTGDDSVTKLRGHH